MNYLGATPSATAPVKIQIGGVIRTITSGTSLSPSWDGSSQIKSWTNWFNLWSAELATKETDLFLYLVYDTTLWNIGTLVSRIPYWNTIADFSATWTNEKARVTSPNINPISTDTVVNIGRFNATLSAGGAYTWSIPATSVIINRPIYETRWLDWQPSVTASGSMTIASLSLAEAKYKISGDSLSINYSATYTTGWTASSDVISTVPFTFLSYSILWFSSPCYDSTDFQASGIYQWNSITIRKNWAAWTLWTGRVFGIHTFWRI